MKRWIENLNRDFERVAAIGPRLKKSLKNYYEGFQGRVREAKRRHVLEAGRFGDDRADREFRALYDAVELRGIGRGYLLAMTDILHVAGRAGSRKAIEYAASDRLWDVDPDQSSDVRTSKFLDTLRETK